METTEILDWNNINEDNYFDYAQAVYWFCVDYHGGQNSTLYSLQCKLGYKPSMNERAPDTEFSQEIYKALEKVESERVVYGADMFCCNLVERLTDFLN